MRRKDGGAYLLLAGEVGEVEPHEAWAQELVALEERCLQEPREPPLDVHAPDGLGFRVWGLGFGVWGLGFGVWGLGFGVWGLGFGV